MDVVVTGVKELDSFFRNAGKDLSHKVVGSALYQASKPIVTSAKARIKSKTGNLVKSIGAVRQSIKKANEIGEVRVGPRVGGGQKGYHGHLVEFGSKNRKPGGWYARFPNAHPTTSKPHPFLQPAFDATKDQVIGSVNENISKAIVSSMKRRLGKSFIK